MRVNPTIKREPDKGRWVMFSPFPISGDGNVQLQETLGQHYCLVVISDQLMDHRDGNESWNYQTASLSH